MKKSVVFFSALCALFSAQASPLTPAQAIGRLGSSAAAHGPARNLAGSRLSVIAELPNLYVVSSGTGYLILPSDDVAAPLLGYSESGEFNPEANPALASWLGFYSEEIESAVASGAEPYAEEADPEAGSRKDVAPMVSALWNQVYPYNAMCPELSGQRCMTGCVATAMAQIMHYHKWPATGRDSHSYNWQRGGRELSVNFAELTFDWENMADTYSSVSPQEQIDAVAELMYAAGVSIDMAYNVDQSGATAAFVGPALIKYFDYDNAMWFAERKRYSLEDWTDLIYSEIEAGRPVLYSGNTASGGGHSFVCDGYRAADGFFHFNWGWSGIADGYFALSALNPRQTGTGGEGGGYNYNQDATVGIQKMQPGSQPTYVMACNDSFTASPSRVNFGAAVTFGGGFINRSFVNLPSGVKIGVSFRPFAGGASRRVYFTENRSIPASLGYQTISVNMPEKLRAGNYAVTPVYLIPGIKEWQLMRAPLDCAGTLKAIVDETTITFTAYDPEEEKDESSIGSVISPADAPEADVWFTIDGKRLCGRPSAAGLYINKSRKVLLR